MLCHAVPHAVRRRIWDLGSGPFRSHLVSEQFGHKNPSGNPWPDGQSRPATGPLIFPTPKMFGSEGGGMPYVELEPSAACRLSGRPIPRASALSLARRIVQTHSDPSPPD